MTDVNINHTDPVPSVVPSPANSAYLLWQDGVQGLEAVDKAIGPAIVLEVNAGDQIELETWARFENKTTYTRNFNLLALSTFLGNTLAGAPGFDGVNPTQVATNFNGGLGSFGFGSDDTDDTRPYAYLNYVLFRDDYTLIDAGWRRVPPEAGFDPGGEGLPDMHQRLFFEQPVVPQENGYLYVWVSNESENTEVWFDDLKVTHTGTFVAQATDYGAWGDVLREQRTDERKYRYGYQGQFSEKDDETGWNHFELREYDAVVGRWTAMDAAKQYWSPYVGMGNDPVNGVDPDGAFKTKFGAQWYAFWHGGGDVEQALGGANQGEWYVGNQIDYTGEGAGVAYQRVFDYGNGNKSFGEHVWNHPLTRYHIPDFVNISIMNFQGVSVAGGSMDFDVVWALRGPEASWKPMITATPSVGVGLDVGATTGFGGYNYLGPANEVRRDFINTTYPVVGGYASGSLAVFGLKAGLTVSVSPAGQSYLVGRQINGGLGFPTVGQGSVGVFNTYTLHDFYKE